MSFKITELTPEQAEKVKAGERNRKNRAAEADAYDEFTMRGKPYFFESIDLIGRILAECIKSYGFDVDDKIISRIKDQESALNNDDISEMNKGMLMKVVLDSITPEDYEIYYSEEDYRPKEKILDDVFGITIIVASEEEKKKISELIKKTVMIDDVKQMNKKEYKAIHLKIHTDKNPEYPQIECQIKTRLENINCRDHTVYKVESAIERMLRIQGKLINPNKKVQILLTPEGKSKVYSVIQQYYNDGMFTAASNIPKMWESRYNKGKMEMNEQPLTEEDTLKRMYPFLNVDEDKERKGEANR